MVHGELEFISTASDTEMATVVTETLVPTGEKYDSQRVRCAARAHPDHWCNVDQVCRRLASPRSHAAAVACVTIQPLDRMLVCPSPHSARYAKRSVSARAREWHQRPNTRFNRSRVVSTSAPTGHIGACWTCAPLCHERRIQPSLGRVRRSAPRSVRIYRSTGRCPYLPDRQVHDPRPHRLAEVRSAFDLGIRGDL
jgi:hypothetical protein